MTFRKIIKRAVKTVFLILAAPLYLLFLILTLISREDGVFQNFSQALSLIPGTVGTYLRGAFYRLACPETSDDISVGFMTLFSHRDTTIEKGVYIGPQCNIGKCTISENTLIGSGVHVLSGSGQHQFGDTDRPIQEQGGRFEKIIIGADCWLGNGAIIMVSMASHCIVAAGAVVTKPTNQGDIVAGNPGKHLRNRFTSGQAEPEAEH